MRAQSSPSQIFVPALTKQGSFNISGWSHPEFERLVTQYQSTLDNQERRQIAEQMARLQKEETPMVIPMWDDSGCTVRSEVSGFAPQVTSSIDLAPVSIGG